MSVGVAGERVVRRREGATLSVAQAIREADALLPGTRGDTPKDPRWQAVIAVGEFIQSEPEAVWGFIRHWGGYPDEDLRDAIATCLLEHLLEYHFIAYFPQVEQLALTDTLFGDMFRRCWQFGQSLEGDNGERFVSLKARLGSAA